MTTATASTAVAERSLTAAERCDRCGAQAYVRVVLEASGGELLFCAHHARKHEPQLRSLAAEWQDETGRLFEKSAPSTDD